MSRSFFVHDGSPRADAELAHWLNLRPEDLGPTISTCAVPVASRPVVVALALSGAVLVLLVLAGVVAAAAGWLPVMALLCPVSVMLGTAALVVPVAFIQGDSRGIEIRRHGLVVGSRPVPFATMDPGRMVWATSARAARHVVTLNRRRRVAGGDCLLLNGTDGPDAVHDSHAPEVGGRYDPLPRAPRLDTPFVWWGLGPRDVPGFVGDLEQAMVRDGYPAHGLAAHLASHRWQVSGHGEIFVRRAARDPVLWRP